MNIPICVNHGCGRPVTYSNTDKNGNKRFRPHCSHCQAASYGKWPHRPGVTPFKKGTCDNHDGRLGFPCLCDLAKAPSWAKGLTDIDHIDGDCSNNDPANLQELCGMCHKLKGQANGDYNGHRPRDTIMSPVKKSRNRKASHEAFDRLFA